MRALIIAGIFFAGSAPALDIAVDDEVIGTVESLVIESAEDDRVLFDVRARLPSFPQFLDRLMVRRGDLIESCAQDLHWVGDTSIRDYGQSLGLESSIRYELWECDIFNTRVIRSSHSVAWRVYLHPESLGNLRITAQVEDVSDIPPPVEEALGLRVTREIDIPMPTDCGRCECSQLLDELNPVSEATRFSREGDDIQITVRLSMSNRIMSALECLQ